MAASHPLSPLVDSSVLSWSYYASIHNESLWWARDKTACYFQTYWHISTRIYHLNSLCPARVCGHRFPHTSLARCLTVPARIGWDRLPAGANPVDLWIWDSHWKPSRPQIHWALSTCLNDRAFLGQTCMFQLQAYKYVTRNMLQESRDIRFGTVCNPSAGAPYG